MWRRNNVSLPVDRLPKARSTTTSVAIGVGAAGATQADGTYKLAVTTTPLSVDTGVSKRYDLPRHGASPDWLSGGESEMRSVSYRLAYDPACSNVAGGPDASSGNQRWMSDATDGP